MSAAAAARDAPAPAIASEAEAGPAAAAAPAAAPPTSTKLRGLTHTPDPPPPPPPPSLSPPRQAAAVGAAAAAAGPAPTTGSRNTPKGRFREGSEKVPALWAVSRPPLGHPPAPSRLPLAGALLGVVVRVDAPKSPVELGPPEVTPPPDQAPFTAAAVSRKCLGSVWGVSGEVSGKCLSAAASAGPAAARAVRAAR